MYKILFFAIFIFFISPTIAEAYYTSAYSTLTVQDGSTNFTDPDAATQVDGNMAGSVGTSYSIKLSEANISALGLPSDAVILGIRRRIWGTAPSGGYIKTHTIDAEGDRCITTLGDGSVSATSTISQIQTGGAFFSNCNNGSWSDPTTSTIGDYGIEISNASSGTANPINIDYILFAVDYESASQDWQEGAGDPFYPVYTCGDNWLSFEDIVCHIKAFFADLFNFFFGFDPQEATDKMDDGWSLMQEKAPFAYVSMLTDLNTENTATSTALPVFPILAEQQITDTITMPALSFTDNDDVVKNIFALIRPYEIAIIYVMLAYYLWLLADRIFTK